MEDMKKTYFGVFLVHTVEPFRRQSPMWQTNKKTERLQNYDSNRVHSTTRTNRNVCYAQIYWAPFKQELL